MKRLAPSMTQAPLFRLKQLMKKEGITTYFVPSGDAHQSEYIQDRDKRRHFISNFTGSAGVAVIGPDKCWMWTDGRYWHQAGLQLGENWELMKVGLPETPLPESFIAQNFPTGSVTGVDPTLLSISSAESFIKILSESGQSLKFLKQNLIDEVWDNRPGEEIHKIIILDEKYSGRSLENKISWIRTELVKNKVEYSVITALDDIAWLFNIRGFDIPYNPVLISYAIISLNGATLYLNQKKVDETVLEYFKKNCVTLKDYEAFFDDLEQLGKTNKNIWIDNNSSVAVYNALKANSAAKIFVEKSPVTKEKSLKNEVELNGTRNSSLRDAVSLVKFFSWLEKNINKENHGLTEASVSEVLLQFRKEQELFFNPSFATIAATGSNASIIHYNPDPVNSSPLRKDKIFLCDSGGQYLDGTTDVTRTFHFGEPTKKEILCYTLVLKGVISLSECIFPSNVTGLQVDAFARRALWEQGLDYRHGTGHGVGHFLNVHEGPHQISFRARAFESPLTQNMLVTNEPGYYEDGEFGIRIENMLVVKEQKTQFNFQNTGFLGFETLTFVPYDYKLIDNSILTISERNWINNYHMTCREKLSPFIKDQETLVWLLKYTSPLN